MGVSGIVVTKTKGVACLTAVVRHAELEMAGCEATEIVRLPRSVRRRAIRGYTSEFFPYFPRFESAPRGPPYMPI